MYVIRERGVCENAYTDRNCYCCVCVYSIIYSSIHLLIYYVIINLVIPVNQMSIYTIFNFNVPPWCHCICRIHLLGHTHLTSIGHTKFNQVRCLQ